MNGPALANGGMTYVDRTTADVRPYSVRVADHERLVVAAEARGHAAANYGAAQKCPRLTKKGRQCQGLASKDTGLCPSHQLQADSVAAKAVDS